VISALAGQGIEGLLALIENRLSLGRPVFAVDLGPNEGATIAWLYEEAEVLERREGEQGGVCLVIRIASEKAPRLMRRVPDAKRIS
jgi:GTP-binding protein HflX